MAIDHPSAPARTHTHNGLGHASTTDTNTDTNSHALSRTLSGGPSRRSHNRSHSHGRNPALGHSHGHGNGHGHHTSKISRLVGRLRSSSDFSRSSHHAAAPFRFRPQPNKDGPGSPGGGGSSPDALVSLDLWTAAYDYLRDHPTSAGLVTAYETIVSQELPDHLKLGGMATTLRDHPDERRCDLLAAIAAAGLAKRRRRPSKSADDSDAQRIVEAAKRAVDAALPAYPSAAVAWCGFCTLTPLLLDPMLAHPGLRAGILHVCGRIPRYMRLAGLLLRDSWRDPSAFAAHEQDARDALLRLYRRLLEFEMNCVCAAASAWNKPAKNVVDWNGFQDLTQAIREAEVSVAEDLDRYATPTVCASLAQGDGDVDPEGDDQKDEDGLARASADGGKGT